MTGIAGRPREPVALLQIASATTVLLIRIHTLRRRTNYLPAYIQDFLVDPRLTFVGVRVKNDLTFLRDDFLTMDHQVVERTGFFDPAVPASAEPAPPRQSSRNFRTMHYADIAKLSAGRPGSAGARSLEGLCMLWLGRRLEKGGFATRTKWDMHRALPRSAVRYAADDAAVSRAVFVAMVDPVPQAVPLIGAPGSAGSALRAASAFGAGSGSAGMEGGGEGGSSVARATTGGEEVVVPAVCEPSFFGAATATEDEAVPSGEAMSEQVYMCVFEAACKVCACLSVHPTAACVFVRKPILYTLVCV